MGDIFYQEDPSFLTIKKWMKNHGSIIAGVTTRRGGNSSKPFNTLNMGFHVNDECEKVIMNRKLLSEKLAIPLSNWVCGEQVHETNIAVVTSHDAGKGTIDHHDALKKVDGFITNQKNILCTAYFADCVPIYYFDPVTNYIGIAHAGWRGTVNHIAKKMVEKLTTKGVDPENLYVVIGPCISQENYEVDERIIQQIDDEYIEKTVIKKADNRFLLNLKQLNMEILLQSGVLHHNIDITSYCTYGEKHLFFSYRRDKGKTGRMLGFIGLV